MTDRTEVWEWLHGDRARRIAALEDAEPKLTSQADPTRHQHQYADMAYQHRHPGADRPHDHEPGAIAMEVKLGLATLWELADNGRTAFKISVEEFLNE